MIRVEIERPVPAVCLDVLDGVPPVTDADLVDALDGSLAVTVAHYAHLRALLALADWQGRECAAQLEAQRAAPR